MQNKNRFIKIWFMIQLMFVDQSEQKLLNFLIQKHSMSSHCKYKDFLRPRWRTDVWIRPWNPGWGRNLIYNFKMGIQRTGQGQDSSPYNGRNGLGLKTFYDCNFYWKWYFWSSRKSCKNFQKDFSSWVTHLSTLFYYWPPVDRPRTHPILVYRYLFCLYRSLFILNHVLSVHHLQKNLFRNKDFVKYLNKTKKMKK